MKISANREKSPESQLKAFIAKYDPEVGALAQAALAKLRARVPGAILLAYDNYNALAIGFGPTERASDIIFSIALYPRWVSMFFMDGVNLPDPQKLLKGGGKRIRHIVLEDAATLDKPEVRALLTNALEREGGSMNSKKTGRIVIKSISAKQRPRRPRR
jgi:hypothetical protein